MRTPKLTYQRPEKGEHVSALIFDHHRCIVLVDAQRVHAAALVGDELRGEEAHTQQGFEICLEERLKRLLQRHRAARQLGDTG